MEKQEILCIGFILETKNKMVFREISAILLLTVFCFCDARRCRPDCHPPDCSCPMFSYPMETREIPQMVYFGFDDAVNVVMSSYYDRIFTSDRLNPNGCTMKFTLYISHEYTDYRLVKQFHEKGNEVAVHSVTHSAIDNDEILRKEAKQQKENIVRKAGVPSDEVVGWRSPFLKTAGNNQPKILHELGYEYDISLTYVKSTLAAKKPWPFTIENGWPYRCGVLPCPFLSREKGFWEVPVVSMMDHKKMYPCSFVDGCAIRANNEDEAFKYLWDNFMSYYNTTRTPFGLNMHAAWFYTPHNLQGMMRFLDELQKLNDVYVVTVKQVLDWMKHPTPLSEISRMTSWGCPEVRWPQGGMPALLII